MKSMQSLLGFIYPNKCMLCRCFLTKLDDLYICRLCYDKIHAEVECLYGLAKDREEKEECICQEGYTLEEAYEELPHRIISLFPYEAEYRQAILRWKYQGIRKYAKGFAKLLIEKGIFDAYEQAILIPIPSSPSRMKSRGFNQALDLANEISKGTEKQVVDCLKRSRDTKPQSKCTREERERNIKNSMIVEKNKCKEVKSIILIDDIYTTGSTIKEAIRTLKKQYAFRNAKIDVVVIGKGSF